MNEFYIPRKMAGSPSEYAGGVLGELAQLNAFEGHEASAGASPSDAPTVFQFEQIDRAEIERQVALANRARNEYVAAKVSEFVRWTVAAFRDISRSKCELPDETRFFLGMQRDCRE